VTEGPAAEAIRNRNARSSSANEVARGFVAPPQYWQMAQPGNTVIVGPRGSGKTTLLKMLRSPTLELWQHPEADRARKLVTYSGVLIPADKSWAGQVGSYEFFDDDLRASLGEACYTLHTLRALSQCAAQRIEPTNSPHPHGRAKIDRTEEERIAADTWRGWGLPEPVGSFRGLSEAASSLIEELGRVAKRASRLRSVEPLREHRALDLDLVEAAIPFIDRFNSAAGQPDHVWALLIDEIEFLPPGIHTTIMGSMRGRDPRLIQKVSIAPYTQAVGQPQGAFSAWVGHDLEEVDLTFQEKEDGYQFATELVEKEIEGMGLGDLTPAQLLGGPGFFESRPGQTAYASNTTNGKAISGLSRKDPSFRQWLAERKINPKELAPVKGVKRASTLRKSIAIILLRDTYLHSVGGRLQRRSRKSPQTYTGEFSAYAICENNPRRLKTLTSRLLTARSQAKSKRFSNSLRAEAVGAIADQFAFYLRAIEVPETTPSHMLPARLVETIGSYFAARIYGQRFDPEPPLSFEASPRDSLADPILRQVLSQLIFYGAVVPIGVDRYRLAHTFAPIYRLPLRAGRPISLQSILAEAGDSSTQMQIADRDEPGE